jgi:hypothetical protein
MKRPLAVTILGGLFIVTGLVSLAHHLSARPLEQWIVVISMVGILAVAGGVFLLMGHGWARWLLLAWLAFHVVVSAFHSWWQCVAHVVLLAVVAYFLLKPPASDYFRPAPSK